MTDAPNTIIPIGRPAEADAATGQRRGPLVALIEANQAPLLTRPYFAGGDPGPIIAALAQVPEDLFRSHLDQLLLPALSEAGLVAGEPEVGPAWSIARP